jgi:hypothetical protein
MALLDLQAMDPVRDNERWDDGSEVSVALCFIED